MAQSNPPPGFTVGDGFRFGLGFAIANAVIALLAAAPSFFALAGVFGLAAATGG